MNINVDITGGAITKLIEVIAQGCGYLYEPTKLKRLAKAEADIKILEQQTDQRLQTQELIFQQNLNSIVSKSVDSLTEYPTGIVDQDWSINFVTCAKQISNNYMQELWAKILAGEINTPGSFSLRTVNTLKNISRSEAELFKEFCSYLIEIDESLPTPAYFTDTYGSHANRFSVKKFTLAERLILQELGLVTFEDAHDIFLSFKYGDKNILNYLGNKLEISYRGKEDRGGEIKTIICGHPLTLVGKELFSIINPEHKEAHWSNLKEALLQLEFEIN